MYMYAIYMYVQVDAGSQCHTYFSCVLSCHGMIEVSKRQF